MIKIFKDKVDITADVCEALYSDVRNIGVKVEVANKVTLTGTEIISCDVEQQILTEDKFNFGTANCNTCELVIDNIGEPYDPKFFIGQEMKVYYTLTTAKNDFVEIPMGIYIIDTAVKNSNKIKISSYDRVLLTEENYNTKTELQYPTTLKQVAQDACQISKAYFSNDDFFNSDLVYNDMVVFGSDTTCRNILQNVAELACGYLRADRNGMLYIQSLDTKTVVDTIYPKNYFTFEILEQKFGPVKSVYIVYDEKDSLYGEGSPQFQIRNNYYTPSDFENLPEKIFNHVGDISYYPATLEWQGNPLFDAGDFIDVIDKKGNTVRILIASQKFSYNGGLKCTIKSVGKSDIALATEKKNIISEQIEGLNRRLNTLKQKVDKAGLETIMSQLDQFSGRLDGLIEEFKEVQMSVTPDGIVNTVTSSKTYQDYLDAIYDGLNGLQGQTVKIESVIAQHADQINMSVKSDNIISSINLDKSGVQIRGDKIQLQGVVTFEDLQGEGTTVINGSNIKTGTLEGINIKGENVDVTAKLSISPQEMPTKEYGEYAYQNPTNTTEWATIDFNVYKRLSTGKYSIIDVVKLKTFAYDEAIYGQLPDNPATWKYGLEIDGAIKAKDNVYIEGENGLVVTGEAGITTKKIRTELIERVDRDTRLIINGVSEIYPASNTYNTVDRDTPFILFESKDNKDNRSVLETKIKSDTSVFINSLNPDDNIDLETGTLRLVPTNSSDSPFNGGIIDSLSGSTSKIYVENLEILESSPSTSQKMGNIFCGNIYASGYYSASRNNTGDGNPDNGSFYLPIKKKNKSTNSPNSNDNPYYNTDGIAVETVFCGDANKSLNTHAVISGGTVTTTSSQVSVGGTSYYYGTVDVGNAIKLINRSSNEELAVVVSANTPGAQCWWDNSYNDEYRIRILSNKANVECSYIIYSRCEETQFINVKY